MQKLYNVTFDSKITLKPSNEPDYQKDSPSINDHIKTMMRDSLAITHDGKIKDITINNLSFNVSVSLLEEGDSEDLVKVRSAIENQIIHIIEDGLNIIYDGKITGIELNNVHYRACSEKEYNEFKK